MPDLSARLSLPLLLPAQAQKHVTHNEALVILDALVQTGITSFDAQTPPGAPQAGEIHQLGAAPVGDWAGQAGTLAVFDGSGWLFLTPQPGWRAWDLAGGSLRVFDGSLWTGLVAGLENVGGVGVNTASDSTNRLAVSAAASLFSHEGAGHQVKINKAAAGDTASLLFQSDWTGHAEIGLAGGTGFALKVSADGSAWVEALKADPATGTLSGAAVQATATDTGTGKLMRADYGYGPGNLLGPVAQSGGVPTGAVIEQGTGANGAYTRWADGTQICWIDTTLSQDGAARLAYDWSFPLGFVGAPVVTVNLGDETGATPAPEDLTGPFARAATATGCTLRLYRRSGAADFAGGDTLPVQAMAVGRWV